MLRVHVLLVDRQRGCQYDLGSLPTEDPDPLSLANQGRITLLLRRRPETVRLRHELIVTTDGLTYACLPVAWLLGEHT